MAARSRAWRVPWTPVALRVGLRPIFERPSADPGTNAVRSLGQGDNLVGHLGDIRIYVHASRAGYLRGEQRWGLRFFCPVLYQKAGVTLEIRLIIGDKSCAHGQSMGGDETV